MLCHSHLNILHVTPCFNYEALAAFLYVHTVFKVCVRLSVCVYSSTYLHACLCVSKYMCGLLLKVHIHPVRPSGGQQLAKHTTERLLCDWSEAVSAPAGDVKNAPVRNPVSVCNISSSLSVGSDSTESNMSYLNDSCTR